MDTECRTIKIWTPVQTVANMPLRDYFAAQAMTMIPYPQHLGLQEYETKHFADYTQRMAAAAYQIADAMLEAREVKP